MSKKLWSMSTTLRNPDRTRNFLLTAREIEGKEWTHETQEEYQIRLIKNRYYGTSGYQSIAQFKRGLSKNNIDLIKDLQNDIPFEKAKEMFHQKEYTDPPMRGRQSLSPLKKMGFVTLVDNKVKITKLGEIFLEEDYDFGDLLFNIFLKWQYPNPISSDFTRGYNTKPFITTLHLINRANELWEAKGNEPVGISRTEFGIFALSLINYKDINKWAKKLIEFREQNRSKSSYNDKQEFIDDFVEDFLSEYSNRSEYDEYRDNIIRYFRATRFIRLRGNGYYIDLSPRRSVETQEILNKWSGEADGFDNKEEYTNYLSDINQPELPWENYKDMKLIIRKLESEINELNENLNKEKLSAYDFANKEIVDLRGKIEDLRNIRKNKMNQINKQELSTADIDKIKDVINKLEALENNRSRSNELKLKPSVALEKWATSALNIINDAIKIKPNYPVDDDNEPSFTAPGNKPDIEGYYEAFNLVCEVTLLTNRSQWFNEGQPVMRHLRDFEEKSNKDQNYALFIAPSLHRDTLNTFWHSCKYEYEGEQQKIIPLRIRDLIRLLEIIIEFKNKRKDFKYKDLQKFLDYIYDGVFKIESADLWRNTIEEAINKLKEVV